METKEISRGITRHMEEDWEPSSTDAIFKETQEAMAGLYGHDGRPLKVSQPTEESTQ